MGILAVDSIRSRTVAPVTVSDDLNVTGVSTVGVLTATSVVVGSGVTVNADGVITSGIVTATTFQGNINGTTGTFSGDVSIGGTLTYEDVERVDATGLSTFREGLNVGPPTGVGGTFNPQGDISAGIGSFSGAISGGALSGTTGTFTGAVSGTTGTFTGAVSDSKGDVRSIPSNAQGGAYVAVAADAGKAVYISTGGVTINNSVFSAGDAITIINNSASDQTVTQGSGVTLHNSADASTGDRTLAGRGMCTIWFASASVAYISGAGLS